MAMAGQPDTKKLQIELARYLLFADKRNIPIKRQDLIKNVLKDQPKLLPKILEGAQEFLKKTFNYTVQEVEHNKNKYYILTNNMVKSEVQVLTTPAHQTPQLGLLLILLSLIHMSDNALDEADLWESLKEFGIEKSRSHIDFGDTEKLIIEFCKQMYIEKCKVTSSKGPTIQYRWGIRSYIETRMKDVLRFCASIYDVDVEIWKKQFSTHTGAPENAE